MHELLPNMPDIRITQKTGRVDAKALDAVDQLVLILPKNPNAALWRGIPQGARLKAAMAKRRSDDEGNRQPCWRVFATSRGRGDPERRWGLEH